MQDNSHPVATEYMKCGHYKLRHAVKHLMTFKD